MSAYNSGRLHSNGHLRGKYRGMLMDAECSQMVGRRLYGFYAAVHSYVPQLHLAATTSAYKLALSAALQVDIGDPLFVFFPDFDHSSGGLLPLIVYADGAITEACNEHISFDLIRSQRRDAGTRSRRKVLLMSVIIACTGKSGNIHLCILQSPHSKLE